jgi:hypothetical protein
MALVPQYDDYGNFIGYQDDGTGDPSTPPPPKIAPTAPPPERSNDLHGDLWRDIDKGAIKRQQINNDNPDAKSQEKPYWEQNYLREGSSLTAEQAIKYTDDFMKQYGNEEWAREFLKNNPTDYQRLYSAYQSELKGGGGSNNTNKSGGGGGTGGVPGAYGSDYPTPDRTQIPTPIRPDLYASSFQPQAFSYDPTGQAERNKIVMAVLNNPETMGQTFQDQLFENQKEMANAMAAQRKNQLGQDTVARGWSTSGGNQQAGQQQLDYDLENGLLAGRRDIATKAVEQNRQDQLAAIQMQQAIQEGDLATAQAIFKANQDQRVQNEQFLQAAASLNANNLLQWNAQNLGASVALKPSVRPSTT